MNFQCSSASRKFLNCCFASAAPQCGHLSVLFSEPKIPQCRDRGEAATNGKTFSALQRAENSSMVYKSTKALDETTFQCSSASRKFLNLATEGKRKPRACAFSALQRAENSSISGCASPRACRTPFSALQRAENSSILTLAPASIHISDRDDHASSFLSLPGASP